jgi:hypothetical protein
MAILYTSLWVRRNTSEARNPVQFAKLVVATARLGGPQNT